MDLHFSQLTPPEPRFDRASEAVLGYLRQSVPMGCWVVSRYVNGRQVYLSVDDVAYGIPCLLYTSDAADE